MLSLKGKHPCFLQRDMEKHLKCQLLIIVSLRVGKTCSNCLKNEYVEGNWFSYFHGNISESEKPALYSSIATTFSVLLLPIISCIVYLLLEDCIASRGKLVFLVFMVLSLKGKYRFVQCD